LGVHFFNPVQVRNPSSLTVEKIICVWRQPLSLSTEFSILIDGR
jgi:hypothetical protein